MRDDYLKKKNAEEMKHQIITFSLGLFLTLLSFIAVLNDFSPYFTVPFILLLAFIQVLFQLYYFMHLKNKGHQFAQLFIYSGLFVGILTIAALVLLT